MKLLRNQKTVVQAKAMLDRMGLKVKVNPANARSDYRVSRQSPGADTRLPKGGTVTIEAQPPPQRIRPLPVTHKPALPSYVNVPDLNQKTVAQAKAMLDRLGLKVKVNPTNARSDYWVYKQNPGADTKLPKGGSYNFV